MNGFLIKFITENKHNIMNANNNFNLFETA